MFVHYFTHVPLAITEVERRIELVRDRMGNMADVAYREGEELRSKVGPWIEGFAKEIDLDIGMAMILSTGIAYPVTWVAHGGEILFPRLNAELLLARVAPETTRIAVEGTYDPPLGIVGKAVDRVLLGRFADATIQHWVDRLAESLVEMPVSGASAGE